MSTINALNRRGTRFAAAAAMAALGLAGFVGSANADPGNGAGGLTGPAFYVDGELYQTVGTPTDLAHTGAPDHSFDVIYNLGGVQMNVAEAKPGDRDFNGGRWQVHAVSFSDYDEALAVADVNGSGTLDSAEEVEAAIDSPYAADEGIVKTFECPVIKL
jgi:hypothetical protein